MSRLDDLIDELTKLLEDDAHTPWYKCRGSRMSTDLFTSLLYIRKLARAIKKDSDEPQANQGEDK